MPSDLALLAHGEVEEGAYAGHLTEREASHLAGLANPRVRRRWLCGRLAAKHLLLGGGGGGRLAVLDGERLRAFPAASYRGIELRPSSTGAPAGVSITHGAGVSCASLGAGGVDLETVEPRVPAFYRGNFTPRERRWADAGSRATGLSAEWLYTLLWTLKEAALKSGATAVRGVWGFAGMEIELPADLPARLADHRGAVLGERFAGFEALVRAARGITRARVETTSTSEAILSLLTASEANP